VRLRRIERAILLIGATLVAAGIVGTRVAPARWGVVFDNLHWTAGYVTGALLAILGWRRATGVTRRARGNFALALTACTVGRLLWDAQGAIGWNPFPGPSDAAFLMLGPGLIAGLMPRGKEVRVAARLDATALTIAVATLTLALYLPRSGKFDSVTTTVLVAYPALLLGAAGTAVVAILHLRLRPTSATLAMVAAIIADGLLWMEWNSRTLDGTLADGAWLNYGFSVVGIGLGLAAARWHPRPLRSEQDGTTHERLARLLPMAVAVAAAVAVGISGQLDGATRTALSVGAVVVLAIAVTRQSLLLGERDRTLAAERLAREHEARFRQIADHIAEVFVLADADGVPFYVSPAFAHVFGTAPAQWSVEAWLAMVDPEDRPQVAAGLGVGGELRYRLVRGDGAQRWVRDRRVRLELDGTLGVAAVIEDITERINAEAQRAQLEAQLAQAQKLESLGTLAGGIAHDFNNILMAIYGHAQLTADEPLTASARASITDILTGCERGRDIVRRVLAFSRHREAAAVPVQPAAIATEVAGLLRAALPSSIGLRIEAARDLPRIVADPAQLHQVVMNLATNAWHAIGDRAGTIVLAVERARLAADRAASLPAGQ